MDSELGSDDDHSGLEPSLGELSDDEEEAVAQPQPDIRQPTQRRSRAIRMLSFVFGQLPEEEAGVSVGSGLLESDGGGMHDSSSSDQEGTPHLYFVDVPEKHSKHSTLSQRKAHKIQIEYHAVRRQRCLSVPGFPRLDAISATCTSIL